jgi:alpha-ketoglutarate-dependent taurine dioxygenase
LDTGGQITGVRYSNQTMQPLSPVRTGLNEFYRAYHEFSTRITSDKAKAIFRLEGGQILLVAGHRVLHARKEFVANAKRHLQDAYFEHDNIRNHLTVIQRRLRKTGNTLLQ